MDPQLWMSSLVPFLVDAGTRLLGAGVCWFVGRWIVRALSGAMDAALGRQHVDPTLIRYVRSALGVVLNLLLVLAILSMLGVETTTFAGLLAAAGVAIGMAWSGLLANFAAGAFLIVLRPVKVGDFVTIGGVTGTVQELGMLVTAIDTPDNIRTWLSNNAVFTATIQNYSTNPHRRVDLKAQLSGRADLGAAMDTLRAEVAKVANVKATPAVEVEILEFNLVGPVLVVRPYAHTDHYWQVYFDTNRVIARVCGALPAPTPTYQVVGGELPPPA